MGQFRMKIAGQVAAVTTVFDSTVEYCRSYLTEEPADFAIAPTEADRELEQRESIAEAIREGIRPRKYSGPHLERSAIQRQFAEYLFRRGTLLFHGSAVAVDGVGYLFTADCGTGKSTHTRLWREVFGDRAVTVNDDKPFLSVREDGVFLSGSPWSGKHGLDTNITVPLRGICILTRSPENRIRPVDRDEALEMLRKQSYCPLDPALEGEFHALVDALAEKVPLWHLECNRDPEAARVSHSAMSAHR